MIDAVPGDPWFKCGGSCGSRGNAKDVAGETRRVYGNLPILKGRGLPALSPSAGWAQEDPFRARRQWAIVALGDR